MSDEKTVDIAAAFAEAGEHAGKILAGVGLIVGGLVALKAIAARVLPASSASDIVKQMAKEATPLRPRNGLHVSRPARPAGAGVNG